MRKGFGLMDDANEKIYASLSETHPLVTNLDRKQPDWVRQVNSICASCQHSQIIRRRGEPEHTVYCHNFSRIVPSDIEECSTHFPIGKQTLRELTQEAKLLDKNWWELRLGFKPDKG